MNNAEQAIANLIEKMDRPLERDEARYIRPGGPLAYGVRSRLNEAEFQLLMSLTGTPKLTLNVSDVSRVHSVDRKHFESK